MRPPVTDRAGSAPWVRTIALFAVVFLGYTAGALLSLKAFGASELGPAFFPPAGVTVAAMLMTPRSRWPAVIAAIALGEGVVDVSAGYEPTAIVGYVLANSVEPLLGASLVLAWCKGVPDLRRRRDLALFVAGAGLLGPLVGGLIGGATVALHLGAWWPGAAMRWFASDGIGVLVVATPILLWPRQSYLLRQRPVETVGILGTTAALSWLAIWTGLQPSLLILPVLALAALRLDVLGAALAGAAAAFAVNLRAASGLSLFEDMDLSTSGRLALIQLLIAVNVLLAMLIAQEAAARRDAARERALEQQERQRLEALAAMALQLSAALTPQDVGRALEDRLITDLEATGVKLGLLDAIGQRLDWVTIAGYPPPVVGHLGDGVPLSQRCVATDVARAGQPLFLCTVEEYEQRYGDSARRLRTGGIASVAGWPLLANGRCIGSLVLSWSRPQRLSDAQQAYMSAVATMVGQAVARAKSYSDEHARAMVLHTAAHPVAPVDAVGLDYAALYRPADDAQGLGGDWYSVMSLPNGRTYLSVGDVIGHGLTAVEDMAQLRSTGNAYAYQGIGPAGVLTELNRFAGYQIQGEFATNLVVAFDARDRSLSYSSAGHPPGLLRRADTGDVIRLSGTSGPVLGPFEDALFTQSAMQVGSGDVLVMYTDGLVEHLDENVEAGIGHLASVIAAWPPEALLDCEAIAADVAPAPRSDDLCLVIVRFR
jgi:integral membrane sensor domain MASE1